MTQDQAMQLAQTEWWVGMSDRDVAEFQLSERLLCMPFSEFQRAVESAMGRPVWTHEFADLGSLLRELHGESAPATFEDVLAKLPDRARVILVGVEP
jgi:hypothetical protein